VAILKAFACFAVGLFFLAMAFINRDFYAASLGGRPPDAPRKRLPTWLGRLFVIGAGLMAILAGIDFLRH
jgi:hypothetical protein